MRDIGVVIKVVYNKGFAFIRDPEHMSRFVYAKDVEPIADFDQMYEGQKVTYEPAGKLNKKMDSKNNGLRAIKVQVCR